MTHPSIRSQAIAALDALRDELPSASAHDVLEAMGDVLRAGATPPRPIADWAQRCEPAALDATCRRAAELLDEVTLPVDAGDVHRLSRAVQVRDRTASAAAGVRYACAVSSRYPSALACYSPLLARQRRFDGALRAVADRHSVEHALGDRRGLLRTTSWTDNLDERVRAPEAPEIATLGRPSVETVTRYIDRAEGARWVEAYARHDETFAEDLRDTIDELRAAGDQVSLVARRWLLRSESAPIELPSPTLALAAATPGVKPQPAHLHLGTLHPTSADAALVVGAESVELRVYDDPGALVSVAFAGQTHEVAAEDEETRLPARLSDAPWHLEIHASDGSRFAAALVLEPPRG